MSQEIPRFGWFLKPIVQIVQRHFESENRIWYRDKFDELNPLVGLNKIRNKT